MGSTFVTAASESPGRCLHVSRRRRHVPHCGLHGWQRRLCPQQAAACPSWMAVPTPASKGFLRYSPAFEESLKSSCPRSLKRTRRCQRPKILPSRTACSWAPRLLQPCPAGRHVHGLHGCYNLFPRGENRYRLRTDIKAPMFAKGADSGNVVHTRVASTPAFDCNMGCHLAGDRLVGRCSGNSRTFLDAS